MEEQKTQQKMKAENTVMTPSLDKRLTSVNITFYNFMKVLLYLKLDNKYSTLYKNALV